jgi:hypothetical protein
MTRGATNDEVIDTLRRFLSPQFKNKRGWDALLAAIADGDTHARDNAIKAFNQLFLSSASGDYLLQRAADQGVQYPENVAMSDSLFRELALLMSNNRLVQEALLEILEVFYGPDSTRARLESAAAPYALAQGDTLVFKFDDRATVEVLFESQDFMSISAATAAEVAGVLSRAFRNAGQGAYANAVVIDGVDKVVVYSNSIGLLGSIQVTGGFANKALQFATKLPPLAMSTALFDWMSSPAAATGNTPSISYGNGVFIMTSSGVPWFGYSYDGIDWQQTAIDPGLLNIASSAYGNGKFVALNAASTRTIWSSDGINWNETGAMPFAGIWNCVTFGNGKFVALDYSGSNGAYSYDGITWFAMALPGAAGSWFSVTYGNGKFVGIAAGPNRTIWSPDGINWNETGAMPLAPLRITYGNGVFVATGNDPLQAAYSYDGINWFLTPLPVAGAAWYALAYGNGKFVAVEYGGTNAVFSYDGVIWLATTVPSAQNWYSVFHGTEKFVAVAANTGSVIYSFDDNILVPLRWDVNRLSLDEVRFAWCNTVAPTGLELVEVGDYVIVSPMNAPALAGYYEVSKVQIDVDPGTGSYKTVSYFSVKPPSDFSYPIGPIVGLSQTAPDHLLFFRPTRTTVAQNAVPSFISQHSTLGGVDVILPATSQAVGREYNQAPFLHEATIIPVTSTARVSGIVTVTTTIPHNLTTGQMVELQNVQGVDAGRWGVLGKILTVPAPDGFTVANEGLNGTGTGGEVHILTAPADDGIGPWAFDPASGLAITSISTTTSVSLVQNRSVSILPVANASLFPDEEGYIVFGFGTKYEVGPVRYLGILGSGNLLLDKGFIFPKTVPSGSDLTWLSQKNPLLPKDNSMGLFLAVDSSAGRIAAVDFIDQAKAAGINANNIVIYPNDKGLGGAGFPTTGVKISDKVAIWAGDNQDLAIEDAHNA